MPLRIELPKPWRTNALECSASIARGVKLAREAAGRLFYGWAKSRIRGRGLDYIDFRDYSLGDDFRDIDWRLSARLLAPDGSPRLVVKIYEEEKENLVLIVVDSWTSMLFWSKASAAAFALEFIVEEARLLQDVVVLVLPGAAGWKTVWVKPGKHPILPLEAREAICRPPRARPELSSTTSIVSRVNPDSVILLTDYSRKRRDYLEFAKTVSGIGAGRGFILVSSPEEIGLLAEQKARIVARGLSNTNSLGVELEELYQAIAAHRKLVRGILEKHGPLAEILGLGGFWASAAKLSRLYYNSRSRRKPFYS